ncbi:MAG: FGGY family carbohydrate kinase, partial [Thermosphaera sp.]
MNFVLGLDLGTTALKGVLVDSSGRIAASTSEEYPLSSPLPGWSEQDPQDWWLALGRACSRLVTELAPTDKLMAVGLSGQMHGAVFLDRQGNVLHPAILWNDQRTAEQCQQIIDLSGGNIVGWTLNPPRTAFTASKILWLRQHRPEIYERVQHVLLPKDYLRYRLTGSFVTDVSDASGTGLLDVARRQWSQATLDALSIPRSWLPDVVESIDISGRVSADAERATGLPVGTPVVGGAADQTAAAIGNGVTRSGLVSLTLGTSGVVYTQLGDVVVDPSGCFHTFCHAVPETWQMMAGVLSAGGSFRW